MEFRGYASSKADLIASIISIPISKLFFKKIVINSVFFSADSRKTFGIPVFKMDWQSNPMLNGYELENLVKFLNILKLIPKELEELLDFVIHYKMAALMEKDQMKIFIFNFLALEVLINKLFELVPERVIIDENWRDFIDSTDIHENNWKNKRNRKRYLKTKFAIVSYVLSPERALNNYNKFKEIKKIRDDVSHGKIKLDQLKLPINELDVLLNEYILYSLESYKFILNKK